ncbi:Predicted membrane protein [Seinonella peptonophila]|uniref:Predicted membrane protein n=1 Tax=Seinonella peptonophila TaxID=112248 RepID=A0A1M4Y7M3_9BACL|nr:DUF2306 domain-containing protein [Seinonella peptonophila]SHF01442.1 Predicted membrane protein [Seinonella peptonophila]
MKKYLYLSIAISVIYIVYVISTNLIIDPQATHFLSNKKNLNYHMNVSVWLIVLYIHVISACLGMISGAINFSTKILQKNRKLHRINGYLYLLSVSVACLTSGYMAPFATGGRINSIGFNMMNIIWLVVTITAYVQIKRKRINQHRNWMVRSYVYCYTNMFIQVITFALYNGFGIHYDISYTIAVYVTILLNFIIAEVIIRKVFRVPTQIKSIKKEITSNLTN